MSDENENVLDGEMLPPDPTRTLAMKAPKDIEEIRHVDPQVAIDYLHGRKEMYKDRSKQYGQRILQAEARCRAQAQVIETTKAESESWKRRAEQWRAKCQKELAMRKWWQTTCCIVSIGLAVVMVVAFTISQMMAASSRSMEPKPVPASGRIQETPVHVLASVNIINGTRQGSGTIISKGETYSALLTAAHNFDGKIGSKCWVYYPDGTYTEGELMAVDQKKDLAIARVPSDTILAHSFIPKSMAGGKLNAVGYSGGEGPFLKNLSFNYKYTDTHKNEMWNLSVYNGPLWDGDSGGGLFTADSSLVGVVTQRDGRLSNCKNLYAVSYPELYRFLKSNEASLAECGDWSEPPVLPASDESKPPLWKPKSNIPIYTENSVEKKVDQLRVDVDDIRDKIGDKPTAPNDGLKRPSDVSDAN